jgi:hypothetical protein
MRCPCGYRIFARRTVRTSEVVSRWMLFDTGTAGAGSTPAGLDAGIGTTGSWGRFDVQLVYGQLEVYCASCKRVRSSHRVGGLSCLGGYVAGGQIYVVAADVVRPVSCFSLRYTGPDGVSYSGPLGVAAGTAPSVFGATPLEVADVPPAGAVLAQQLLSGPIPEIDDSGVYRVEVVDSCASNTILIMELELEANVQILIPQNADLHGAPSLWLKDFDVDVASLQPAGSPICTVPFDKCSGVIEYDASHGSLPTAQGWSLEGSGSINDFGIVEGRVLRMSTTVQSYFERGLSLSSNPGRVHGYIEFRRSDFSGSRGLDFQALYATNAAPYSGARLNARDAGFYKMELDAGASTALGIAGRPAGWESLGGSQVTAGPGVAWRDDYAEDATATYGTVGSAGATEIRCRFGDTNGDGLTGYIRHVVVSAPGRFIRAGFAGYAEAAEPTLRFGLSRLVDNGVDNTARFKITYGQNGEVYGAQASTLSFTALLSAANSVVEFPLKMLGLLAQRPFWFTVERDWSHGDDLFASTVHLHYVTVRTK